MEGLVDPRVFESRAGLLVGIAFLAVFLVAIVVGYAAEAAAKRRQHGAERASVAEEEKEPTGKAA